MVASPDRTSHDIGVRSQSSASFIFVVNYFLVPFSLVLLTLTIIVSTSPEITTATTTSTTADQSGESKINTSQPF